MAPPPTSQNTSSLSVVRSAVVLCATSFLLGLIFTHWIADHGTLWQTPTPQSLSTALSYYRVLVTMPIWMQGVLVGVASVGIGAMALGVLKGMGVLGGREGREAEWVFEGGGLFLYGAAFTIYYTNAVPTLSLIPPTHPSLPPPYAPLPSPPSPTPPTPDALLPSIPPQLVTAIRDLAAAHLICAVALTGVLLFQAGSWWSEREREEDVAARVGMQEGPRMREEGTPGETTSAAVTEGEEASSSEHDEEGQEEQGPAKETTVQAEEEVVQASSSGVKHGQARRRTSVSR